MMPNTEVTFFIEVNVKPNIAISNRYWSIEDETTRQSIQLYTNSKIDISMIVKGRKAVTNINGLL